MNRCSECEFDARFARATGPTPARILFLGEKPGRQEAYRGFVFCLDEDTKVLTLDLCWIPIREVVVGQWLLSCDEYGLEDHPGVSGAASRRWRPTQVTAVHKSKRKAQTYYSEFGKLTMTPEHRVLSSRSCGGKTWVEASKLQTGSTGGSKHRSNLSYALAVWDQDENADAAWLAGFLCGEGHLMVKRRQGKPRGTFNVGFSQNEGPTLEEALTRLKRLGFDYFVHSRQQFKGNVCKQVYIRGGFKETLRFLGYCRPSRLLHKALKQLKSSLPPEIRLFKSRITKRSARAVYHNVVDIQTTSHTFIANGFVVHNCGDTGEELNNTYFPLAGLERGEVRMSNCVRCWLGGTNNKPSAKQIDACARNWTPREVEKTEPEIIVLLGATACSLIPSIEIEKDHGLPFLFDSEAEGLEHYFGKFAGCVWPMYHPAAALHDTGMMRFLLEDFENFGRWLQGKWQPPKMADIPLDYRVLESNLEFDRAWEQIVYASLPCDTEDDDNTPWSLQFSPAPGLGYLIFARSKLVQRFARCLEDLEGGLLLHFAMHDQNILERMGVNVRKITVQDTMQEAYQLCNLPQGLKSLAWRRLGVRMRSWEDTVLPYSREKMLGWLMQAWDLAADEKERVETFYKRMYRGRLSKVEWKASYAEKKAKHILKHSANPEYDIWDKSEEAGLVKKFEPVLGVAPRVSIVNVPIDIAVHYACQDADLTGRLETVLAAERELRAGSVWKVREEDWDE